MIELGRLKRWIAALVLVVTALAGVVVLRQAADAVFRAASGADPASIFNEVPPPPSALLDVVEWLPDPVRDGREMEPNTRRMITDAYVRALAALDRVGRGDPDAPLAAYLGRSALDDALEHQLDARSVISTTVHLRQDLQLEFYSDDGSVVAVSVPAAEVVRIIEADPKHPRRVTWSDESWRFAMILEDGNWRVQQLEIVSVEAEPPAGRGRALEQPLNGTNTVTVNAVDPTWASYDDAVGATELTAVLDLGLDTVRVFVAGPQAGPVDTDALGRFLDLAAARGVRVVPVLFDGAADHSPATWRTDRAYLDRIVGQLAGHEAIVMWDLKNEPDLDDARSGGGAIVDAWLDRIAAHVRSIDPSTPLTVGWASAGSAMRALSSIDVVSFHAFGSAAQLASDIRAVRAVIGDRQLVVSEFGHPSWVGFVRGDQPAGQAREVDGLVDVIRDATSDGSLQGSMVWLLRDPDRALEPGLVASRASTSYGLLRADGTERPLAAVVRSAGEAPLAGAPVVERLRGWLPAAGLVLAIALLFAAAVATVVRRRRRPALTQS